MPHAHDKQFELLNQGLSNSKKVTCEDLVQILETAKADDTEYYHKLAKLVFDHY